MKLKEELLGLLSAYEPSDAGEIDSKTAILGFVANSDELGRPNGAGHLTGSAFVVNRSRDKALLNHHAKLDMWLQFGGHVEAGELVLDAALRETREESGLRNLELASPAVFDIDVHLIPERNGVAAHYHYDIRFLVIADEAEPLAISEESRAIVWVPMGEVARYSTSESILRMKRKVEAGREGEDPELPPKTLK
jgi:ADP-ribose pyrophosphatase YjhB (NUDIX family)